VRRGCTGSLPGKSWALGMQSLEGLLVNENALTGQLPAEWFSTVDALPKLLGIDLRWNKLNGPVPRFNIGRILRPRLYIVPMDEPFGLCGESPIPGPILMEHDLPYIWEFRGRPSGFEIALPSCPSSKARLVS
jgi:hypothetical protein